MPGTCWAEPDLLAMQGVRCSIPVPGTCWGRARFASNARRPVLDSGARHLLGRIPVPGTCWGRRAISFASILLPFGSRIPVPGTCWAELDLLAIQGVRCPIPVPGTCWAELDLIAMQGVRYPIPVLGSRIPRAPPPLGSGWLRLGSRVIQVFQA